MSGPPRPRCRLCDKSDCQRCKGAARILTGDPYHESYFGTGTFRDDSIRPAGRLLKKEEPA